MKWLVVTMTGMAAVILYVVLFIWLTSDLHAQTCGPPNYDCSRSDQTYAPLPAQLPTWGGLVGANTIATDPDFHNRIVRVTDGSTELGMFKNRSIATGLGGSGDVPYMWNSNSTLLLVNDTGGRYFPITFDPAAMRTNGPVYGKNPVYLSGQGLFSHTNPNVFYAIGGGLIKKIDYSNRSVRPVPQQLYNFHACGLAGFTFKWQTIGGSDFTDTVFSLAVSTTGYQGTGIYVLVANIANKTCFRLNTKSGLVVQYPSGKLLGAVNIPDRFYIHNIKMKGSDTVVVARQGCINNACMDSNGPYFWKIGSLRLASPDHDIGGHWSAGCQHWLNQPGNLNRYMSVRDYSLPSDPNTVWSLLNTQCNGDGQPKCASNFDMHMAWTGDCTTDVDRGWAFASTVSTDDSISNAWQNEIIGWTTDGTNVQKRFAHTFTNLQNNNFAGAWAIGQPSPDGRFFAWSSASMGRNGCANGTVSNCDISQRRTDVFVVELR